MERLTLLLGELGRLREFLLSVDRANTADHSLGLAIQWVDKAMTSLEGERQRSRLWPKFIRSAMVSTPLHDLCRAFCRADGDGYFCGLEEQGEIMRRIEAIRKQCFEN